MSMPTTPHTVCPTVGPLPYHLLLPSNIHTVGRSSSTSMAVTAASMRWMDTAPMRAASQWVALQEEISLMEASQSTQE